MKNLNGYATPKTDEEAQSSFLSYGSRSFVRTDFARTLERENAALRELLNELDDYWTFDNGQQHTHSWHDKQDFMEKARAVLNEIRTDRALALCESHEAQERDNASLADRLSGAELERDALGAQCETLTAERDSLKAEAFARQAQLEGVMKSCDELKDEVTELQSQIEDEQAHNYSDALTKVVAENRELHAAITQLRKEIAAVNQWREKIGNRWRAAKDERDSLKAELQQEYQDYDALRIQKDNEIRALKSEVEDNERWIREVLTDFRIPFDDHTVGRRLAFTQWMCDRNAEIARLQKERDELEEVCCDNLTELVAVLQPYELSLGPNVKLVDVIAQLTRERDEARAELGMFKMGFKEKAAP